MEAHDRIMRLAAELGISPEALVQRAVRKLERDHFWQQCNEGYERLKADPAAWSDYQAEIRAWDVTLQDGLEAFPYEESDSSR